MTNQREVVASVDELDDGDMKQVSVGDMEVLLTKLDGTFYATGAYCSHYGAPLADGVLEEGTGCVVCPWHHAVFDVTEGDLVEAPARDDLSAFEVTVEGDDVIVEVPEGATPVRPPELKGRGSDERHFVIVGGGAAGSTAAETLRREGFGGRITMITADAYMPYDRPNLSKAFLSGEGDEEWLPLRDEAFYDEADIDVMANRRVVGIQEGDHSLQLDGGDVIDYDQLLLATGGEPRELDIPGVELDGVHLLRSRTDAETIVGEIDDEVRRAVVIGSSFIGMEVAASLTARDIETTVVSIESEPFEGIFGPQIGRTFRELHEENDVYFELETGIERFEGDGRVKSSVLDDGTALDTDLVVIGIGVSPATSFASTLETSEDGGIVVDAGLQAADDIYAAGDIARFPDPRTFRKVRIEHWRLAQQHGEVAARNMLGKDVSYDEVPFFWTRQFGRSFKYVGHADQWEDVIIDGDLDERDFVAYYVDGEDVLAAAGTRGDDLTYIHALMRHDEMPNADEITGGFELP